MNNETNKLIPELRFPEFVNDGKWNEKQLSDVLDYERPDNYIVNDTNYLKSGIPVLTANKSFILGYTDEDFGIYNKIPAIIFDDFTVDNKYVDFPFKVKSSAIKILKAKEQNNLKFIYELISQIKFNSIEHKRYYISEYQNLNVLIPSPTEQQKIANFLFSLDELINAQNEKLETLKIYKKGLMQNLFPKEGEKVPKLRFKEFEKYGDWERKNIESYIELFSGIALKSNEISDDQSGIPILRGINITEGHIRHSKDIDKFYLGDLENLKRFLIKENDIVIGMDGSKVGKNVALIKKEDENSILIQRVARIRTKKNANIQFVYQHFISDDFRTYVDRVNTSSGIPHISSQQIKDFKISFPPKVEEQTKIADTLSSLDDMIKEQSTIIEELKSHKRGLMQGLFPTERN